MAKSEWGRIRKLPSGRFQAAEPLGDTKYQPAPHTFATRTEARRWLRNRRTEIEQGLRVLSVDGTAPFSAWAARWLASRERRMDNDQLSPKTYIDYEAVLRVHVLPFMGPKIMNRIEPQTVREFQEWMKAKETKPRPFQKAEKYSSWIMGFAVREGVLRRNPFSSEEVSLSNAKFHRAQLHLTQESVERLARAVKPEYRAVIMIAAYMGLRSGEIWGLRVRDVNLFASRLTVRRNFTEVSDKYINDKDRIDPKIKGNRTGRLKAGREKALDIPAFVLEELKTHLRDRNGGPDDPLFLSARGKSVRHSTWYKRQYLPAAKSAGLPSTIDFHSLRHYCGSWYLAQGYPAFVVQTMLDHSDAEMTRLYSHILPGLASEWHKRADEAYRRATSFGSGTQVVTLPGTPSGTAENDSHIAEA